MENALVKLITILEGQHPNSTEKYEVELGFLKQLHEIIEDLEKYTKDLTNQYEELKDYNRLLRAENGGLRRDDTCQ